MWTCLVAGSVQPPWNPACTAVPAAASTFPHGSNVADPASAVLNSALLRVGLTALGSHWAMTAVAGAGVGYIVAHIRGGEHGGVLPAVACLLVAMAMHLIFDAPRLATGIKVGVNFAIVVVLYLLLSGLERFLVEFIRRNHEVLAGLTAPQLESVALCVIGSLWLAAMARRGGTSALAQTTA